MTFKAKKISDRVYWVGAIDKELRNFHGYNTSRGTTYNAFLITGDKPILIDTVKEKFADEMLERISSVMPPDKIQYIISNHSEMDHTGALPKVIPIIKPEQIFASRNGVKALQEHFHWDEKITAVADKQILDLGDSQLQFFETRMVHWPDSMFTYLVNDKILFSQDAFGMHMTNNEVFADECNRNVIDYEAAKYFANIILPFTQFIGKALLAAVNLEFDYIAPDHGPIWRGKDCQYIVQRWENWALQKRGKKVVIIYDTMWGSTAKMAKAIAKGCKTVSDIEVKLLPLSEVHRSDVATEILEAGALLVGSPVLNQQIFPTLADVLTYLKGLRRQDLIGQYFGSYGWSQLALNSLGRELDSLHIERIGEPVLSKYVPDKTILEKCQNLGQTIAQQLVKT